MLVGTTIAVAAFLQASSPILWRDLTYRMTRDQVDAALPDKKLILSPECDATVSPFYQGRMGLTAVRLNANQTPGMSAASRERARHCQDLIISSLMARYGDPIRSGPEAPPCNNSTPVCRQQLGMHELDPEIETVWQAEQVEIKLLFYQVNYGAWRIVYTHRPAVVERRLPPPTAAPNL